MFECWGSGEWAFSIWVIGYFITFLIYLYPCGGRKNPECMNLASVVMIFIWPLIWVYWIIILNSKGSK